jgi:hypothetical protein
MRVTGLVLAAFLAVSCTGDAPALPSFDVPSFEVPSFDLPSFDTAAVERLVGDALAEVDRVASDPPELPPDFQRLLDENDIELPTLPSNAAEICDALGAPSADSPASERLRLLMSELVAWAERGLVVGVLSVVIVHTCPLWMPHLERAVEDFLGRFDDRRLHEHARWPAARADGRS